MTGIEDSFTCLTGQDDSIKATISYLVSKLTSEGYWTWQIARMLDITECEVVAYQGRA